MYLSLFESIRFWLECSAQNAKNSARTSTGSWHEIFFEKGTRGGICYVSDRYSKANNKYLKYYDPRQESKHIIYLYANNLYGYANSKFLPTSEFRWIDPKELTWINIPAIVQRMCLVDILKSYKNSSKIIL